jgi:thiosulfate dehydrogenase
MSEQKNKKTEEKYIEIVFKLLYLIIALMLLVGLFVYINVAGVPDILKSHPINEMVIEPIVPKKAEDAKIEVWIAPDTATIANDAAGKQIKYGRLLIANTAFYFGPNGSIQHSSNGMNCQNCHLDAGTKPFGNNYSAVAATYPKFRERSGKIESIYKRVNDCFERSLNGTALDTMGKEMQAIKAYILWLGKEVQKGEKPKGAGLTELAYLPDAASPENGKLIYISKCQSCHGNDGQGKLNTINKMYQYPPLWGNNSYNTGAGLYRLSRFAGYVKSNMPLGATFQNPQLTDQEAWDIAAFVNSQNRPEKDLSEDWPKIAGKPVDHPFGPYTDAFSETQHKYGPFEPIAAFKKKQKK